MRLHSTSNTGKPICYQVFPQPLDHLQTKFTDQGRTALEILEKDRVTYAAFVPDYDFHQVVLGFHGIVDHVDSANLEIITASSYNVLAVRKGQAVNVTPIVVEGLIETSDRKFTYGIRGGNVKAGSVNIAPTGHCDYKHSGREAIFAAFYEELREELGLLPEDISSPVVLGCTTDPDFTRAISFVFYAKTDLSFEEINRKHQLAWRLYAAAKERGADEKTARNAIQEAGHLNIDAWEHSQILAVDNDRRVIDHTIKARAIGSAGDRLTLLDLGHG